MPQPAFLSLFEQPNSRTANSNSTLKANSASNKTALQVFDESLFRNKKVSLIQLMHLKSKKRFSVKSAKSKKMSGGTVRRLMENIQKNAVMIIFSNL